MSVGNHVATHGTICPETITELIRFDFWDVKITLRRQKWILPEAQNRQKLRYGNPSNPL